MKFTKFSVAAMLFAVAVLPSCQKDDFNSNDNESVDYKGLVVNEVSSIDDFVEIYNGSSAEIDLSGFIINDASSWDDEAYIFADGAKIGASEFIVVYKDVDFTFGIGSGGDNIYLLDASMLQVDLLSIPAAEDGKESYGRSTDGGETLVWFDIATPGTNNTTDTDDDTPSNSIEGLCINEASYGTDDVEDFVELYNSSDATISLAGFILSDSNGVDSEEAYTLPDGAEIESGAFFLMTKDVEFLFGIGGADKIQLYNTDKELVADLQLPAKEDGVASYGCLTDGSVGSYIQYSEASAGKSNSKGEPFEVSDLVGKIVINEIYTFGDQGTVADLDWIELYNTTDDEISLEGLTMWESGGVGEAWTLPAGSKIAAKGLFVVNTDKYALYNDPTNYPAWGLSKGPDEYIVLATATFAIIDEVACPSMNENESYGRITDGAEDFQIFAQCTKGTTNTGDPRADFVNTSGVYVNEVYTDNSDEVPGDHDWDTDRDYIELYNANDYEVDLSGWAMTDDNGGDVLVIAEGTKIAAKGFLVFEACLEDEDKNPIYDPMNFEFGLGKSGDWVFLYDSADRNYSDLVDQIEIPSFKAIQDNGYTYGRETDGADEWVIFTEASKGASNNGKSTYSEE